MQKVVQPMILDNLRGFAISEPGLEDVSVIELKELVDRDGKKGNGVVTFPLENTDELAHLCYRAQSMKRVCLLIAQFTSKDILSAVENKLKGVDFHTFVDGKSFAVECSRNGKHSFSSADIAQKVSDFILNSIKKSDKDIIKHENTIEEDGKKIIKVDYKNPNVRFFVHIRDNHCSVGVDFTGFDLAQREYRVFSHAASLKATVVYGILRLAEYEPTKFLVSNFSKSGLFIIEAALFASGKSANHYRKDKFAFWRLEKYKNTDPSKFFKPVDDRIRKDKLQLCGVNTDLRHVSAGKKNAKIAGVDKFVGFSRIDSEWLDVKYKKDEIDILVAYPTGREKQRMKEFFHQAEYVAKKVVVVSLNKGYDNIANEFGFSVTEERILMRGETRLIVQIFRK
jgi:putative N6-adenine-specific DNA methylase